MGNFHPPLRSLARRKRALAIGTGTPARTPSNKTQRTSVVSTITLCIRRHLGHRRFRTRNVSTEIMRRISHGRQSLVRRTRHINRIGRPANKGRLSVPTVQSTASLKTKVTVTKRSGTRPLGHRVVNYQRV